MIMGMSRIKLAPAKSCTGCMACVDVCGSGALHQVVGRDGHYYVEIDREKCVKCGACVRACPVVSNLRYSENLWGGVSKPFAAWCRDSELIRRSASGGVFAALAVEVLRAGGVVIGSAMETSVARHIAIESVEDLHKLQGSKYQQSATPGIYRTTLEYLKSGRTVLFSGLGCQIGALYQFLGNRRFDNLITVDLICGGVPSRLIIEKFLSLTGYNNITGYRDKIEGWFDGKGIALSVEHNDESLRIPLKDSFVLKAFLGSLTKRYSCADCKFNGIDRMSDITIADFWGIRDYKEQHAGGISVAITHSERGEALLRKADVELHAADWRSILLHNPRLAVGKILFFRYRIERRFIDSIFAHMSMKNLEIIYAGRHGGVVWLPYRAMKYVLWRWQMRYNVRRVKKILSSLNS